MGGGALYALAPRLTTLYGGALYALAPRLTRCRDQESNPGNMFFRHAP